MKRQLLINQVLNKGPSHLVLHVTNRCNLRCKTCFVDTNSIQQTDEISISVIREISNALKDLIFVDIGGGEPFLRADLVDICSVLNTQYLAIPTNGFDPEYIHNTVLQIQNETRVPLTLSVSLDGFKETNDEIRGAGAYQNAIQTIALLKTIPGIYLTVNTVLSSLNHHEIIEFMKHIRGLDPDFHSISFLRGNPRSKALKCPSIEELQTIKDAVLVIWRSYAYGLGRFEKKILRNYHKNIYKTSLAVMEENRQIPRCRAYKDHLVVYPNGDAAFCEMRQPFGNIAENPLTSLLQKDDAREQIRQIKKGACFCYHNCNLMDNYFLNIFQYPKLILGL